MNPLTNVKNIQKLSEQELKRNFKTSWHDQYKDSAWVFIGGLPYDLTEGDVICVFSQYGEVVNLNLVRDKSTGKSKGFCFLCYEDQRSTILAVDNFNGMKVLGRVIRVDHVNDYKPPKESKNIDDVTKTLYETGCAPGSSILSISSNKSSQEELDTKDGIKNIKKEKKKKSKKEKSKRSAKKKSRKKKKKRKKEESSSSSSSSESSSEASDSSSDDESGEEDGGAVKDAIQGKESKKTGDFRNLKDGKVSEETVRVKVEEEEEEKRRRRRREERTKDSRWRGEDGEWTRKENCASEASDGGMVMRRGVEGERGGGSRGEQSGERRGESGTSRGREEWWECDRRKRVEEERRHENGENGVERRRGREAEWGGGRRERGVCVDDRPKKDRFEREARGVEEGWSRKGGECPDRFESDYNDRKEEGRKKRDKRSVSPQERNYGKSKRSR